jgi:uncharacterized phage protein (TIGR02218 family)
VVRHHSTQPSRRATIPAENRAAAAASTTPTPPPATLSFILGSSGLPEAGDAVVVTAGCDKSFSTCKAKFGNGLNFRGFPHLPGNDRAYEYVSEGAVFDGGALVP